MDLPDTQQLAQVMSQSTAPAFVLGAVAGFVSILLGRMTTIIDRIRSLNEIAEDDRARAHLKSDIPRLQRRASLLNSAVRLALLKVGCARRCCSSSGLQALSSSCSTNTEPRFFLGSPSAFLAHRCLSSARK
jgi:hypothetical protein